MALTGGRGPRTLAAQSRLMRANAADIKEAALEDKAKHKEQRKTAGNNIKNGLSAVAEGVTGLFGKKQKKRLVVIEEGELLDVKEVDTVSSKKDNTSSASLFSSCWPFFSCGSCADTSHVAEEEQPLLINEQKRSAKL